MRNDQGGWVGGPKPGHGGHRWVFLQDLLGLRRLGWNVLFLSRRGSAACFDDEWHRTDIELYHSNDRS